VRKLARGKHLTTAQKRQIGSGNPQPIDDVRDERARAREQEVKAVEERRRIAEEKEREDREFYRKMTTSPDTNSSNGHTAGQPTNFT
jgi:hypothetical protein